jgi:tetratricopeptide (TPR) repeat protein
MKKLLTILLLSCCLTAGYSQGNLDETLGAEYLRRGDFDKAAVVYKRLFENYPSNTFYYESWFSSMVQIKAFKDLEKELKKIIKKSATPDYYLVDLGYAYLLDGDEKDARKSFEEVNNHLPLDQEYIGYVAGLFMHRDQVDYALEAYQKGRKLLKNNLLFISEIAEIYHSKKEYQKMMDEYINLMEKDPTAFEIIKGKLQEAVAEDQPYEIFRKAVLKKVQSNPDNIEYSELLSWLFLQRKDFNSAFVQERALDKKLKEGGRRLIDLAKIAADYQEFDISEKIYQAVIDQGREGPYFIPAQRGLLDIKYIKVTQTGSYSTEDVQSLEKAYEAFINSYGMGRPESGEVVLKLAEIRAIYGNRLQDAIDLLEKYVLSNAVPQLMARAKLALGDYYLLSGEVWESTLRYSQVEKMFENAPLGHEAKFRNAKLAFYNGEFEWATAQLDVLKGSTSELIANDALQLSLVIQENTVDSNDTPLRLFASAGLLIFRNQFDDAQKKLDSINTLFPGHSLEDDIWMLRAQVAMKKRDYPAAFDYYEKVYTKYGDDVLADDALFKAAQLQEKYLNKPEKAKELYEKLILDYKGSVYAVEARNRFRMLRGDVVN